MAFESTGMDIVGLAASGDLSTKQFFLMLVNASGLAATNTTGGGKVDGVLLNKPTAAGQAARVQSGGVAKCSVGAAVTAGDLVMSDAAGQTITATTGANNYAFGRAMETATGANQIISVALQSYGELA